MFGSGSGRRRLTGAVALLAICLGATLTLRGDSGADEARYQRLGNQLICTCGCTEGALTCSTLGCTTKLQIQSELHQRVKLKETDAQVLQSFVQEYGPVILANPTTTGFNLLAWVMPWVMLGLGLLLVLWFVHRWRSRQPAAAVSPAEQARIASRVQAEIAANLEDWEKPK